MIKTTTISLATISIIGLSAPSLNANSNTQNNFAGWHAGVSIGVDNGRGKFSMEGETDWRPLTVYTGTKLTNSMSGKQSEKGIIGGLNFGFDHFFTQTYFAGIEAAVDLSSLQGKSIHKNNADPSNNYEVAKLSQIQIKTDRQWAVSAALRFGMLIDANLLAYGHVGWVGSKWGMRATMTEQPGSSFPEDGNLITPRDAVINLKKDKLLNGLRVVLGMAKMVNSNVQCGIDVAYTWFGKLSKSSSTSRRHTNNGGEIITIPSTFKAKISPQTMEGRLFMKWKFNGVA